jgi:hypothetical protein
MNRLLIQSAENVMLSSELHVHIPSNIEKYRSWCMRTVEPICIPADGGYYEVAQTRAALKSDSS